MSRIGESKVEWGPLRSPKSSQAQNTKTKTQKQKTNQKTHAQLSKRKALARSHFWDRPDFWDRVAVPKIRSQNRKMKSNNKFLITGTEEARICEA